MHSVRGFLHLIAAYVAAHADDEPAVGSTSFAARSFPMETRAMAIAFFYAIGTALGGITGPLLFADLTSSGKVGDTVTAFMIDAAIMCAAGVVAAPCSPSTPSSAAWRTSPPR